MEILVANIIIISFYGIILANWPISIEKRKKTFLCFAFIHLLLLNLFKEPTAFPDLDEYDIYFNEISTSFSNFLSEKEGDRVEWGWFFLNKILHMIFNDNSFVLIILMAVLTLGIYMLDIYKYSRCLWLSVFILFCTNYYPSLFILRQHLAIPICFFSIQYILNRSFKKFITCVLIAMLFHYSAVIWILAYFVYPLRFQVKHIFYSILGLFIFARIMEWLLENIALVLPIVASYGVDAFGGVATEGGAFKPFMFDLFVILLVIGAFKGLKNINGINWFCLLMLYISLLIDVFHIVGSAFAEFSRLGLYFGTCSIFLVPNAIMQIKNKYVKILITFVICVLYIFTLNAFCNYGYKFAF